MFKLLSIESFYLSDTDGNVITIIYVEQTQKHIVAVNDIIIPDNIPTSISTSDGVIKLLGATFIMQQYVSCENYVPTKVIIPSTTLAMLVTMTNIVDVINKNIGLRTLHVLQTCAPNIFVLRDHGSSKLRIKLLKPMTFNTASDNSSICIVYPMVSIEYIPGAALSSAPWTDSLTVDPDKLILDAKKFITQHVIKNEYNGLVRAIRNICDIIGTSFVDQLLNDIGE